MDSSEEKQIRELFDKITLTIDTLFKEYQWKATLEERELLKFLCNDIYRDLNWTMNEALDIEGRPQNELPGASYWKPPENES